MKVDVWKDIIEDIQIGIELGTFSSIFQTATKGETYFYIFASTDLRELVMAVLSFFISSLMLVKDNLLMLGCKSVRNKSSSM